MKYVHLGLCLCFFTYIFNANSFRKTIVINGEKCRNSISSFIFRVRPKRIKDNLSAEDRQRLAEMKVQIDKVYLHYY
jgi:hypothetical protein